MWVGCVLCLTGRAHQPDVATHTGSLDAVDGDAPRIRASEVGEGARASSRAGQQLFNCAAFTDAKTCSGTEVVAQTAITDAVTCKAQCVTWMKDASRVTTDTKRCCKHETLNSGDHKCSLYEADTTATFTSTVTAGVNHHQSNTVISSGVSICTNGWSCGSWETGKRCTGTGGVAVPAQGEWVTVVGQNTCENQCDSIVEKGTITVTAPGTHVCCAMQETGGIKQCRLFQGDTTASFTADATIVGSQATICQTA